MQMVRLVRDGQIIKASKRSGKAITLVTLLDEVPIDAARFFFNLREANSHFDFDLDLAVEQSSQNPVYYVQYAHARICSIVKNLAGEGISPRTCTAEELSKLTQPEEIESDPAFGRTAQMRSLMLQKHMIRRALHDMRLNLLPFSINSIMHVR